MFKLQTEHKEDLKILTTLDPEFVAKFCRASIKFIKSGVNQRQLDLVAKELNVNTENAEKAIRGLSFLFTECAKAGLSPSDFNLTITELEMNETLTDTISKLYESNWEEIRKLFVRSNETTLGISEIPQFKQIEWRLDVEVDKRSIRNITNPIFIMKIDTTKDSQFISAEYHDLKHIAEKLGTALKEIKTQHARRAKKIKV